MSTKHTQPKTQFTFIAQYADGSDEELTIELATPINTPNSESCNQLKMLELLNQFKTIQANKLSIFEDVFEKDDKGNFVMEEIKDKDGKVSSQIVQKNLSLIQIQVQETKLFDHYLEVYSLVVDKLLSQYSYPQNDKDSNKHWFNILNFQEIAVKYEYAWQPFLDRMKTVSQSQTLTTSKN